MPLVTFLYAAPKRVYGARPPSKLKKRLGRASGLPGSVRRTRPRQDLQGDPHGRGNRPGPDQTLVIEREPPIVLGQAELEKRASRKIAKFRVARHRESFLGLSPAFSHLCRMDRVPDQLFADLPGPAQVEERPRREGGPRAKVRRPVHEKENVARLLLHDRLEDVDQSGRKDSGPSADREEPEREEGIDAFSVPGPHEGPDRIARRLRIAEGLDG